MSLPIKNPAYFLHGPGIAKIDNTPYPTIEDPHDVIIRIAYLGVCGSDVSICLPAYSETAENVQVHFWRHGGIGAHKVEKPLIMGHEASGTVHEIGDQVESLKIGDQVAIEPGAFLRLSAYCVEPNVDSRSILTPES